MALSSQRLRTMMQHSQDAEATGFSADDAEFVAIIPQYATAILRVAAALVGPADAEDAAQEAITRGWQAWPTLRDSSAARCVAVAYHRQRLSRLAARAFWHAASANGAAL